MCKEYPKIIRNLVRLLQKLRENPTDDLKIEKNIERKFEIKDSSFAKSFVFDVFVFLKILVVRTEKFVLKGKGNKDKKLS